MGDDDGIANGIIVDTSGLAAVSSGLAATGAIGGNNFGVYGGGCFIDTSANGGLTKLKLPAGGILIALVGVILMLGLVTAIRLKSKIPD